MSGWMRPDELTSLLDRPTCSWTTAKAVVPEPGPFQRLPSGLICGGWCTTWPGYVDEVTVRAYDPSVPPPAAPIVVHIPKEHVQQQEPHDGVIQSSISKRQKRDHNEEVLHSSIPQSVDSMVMAKTQTTWDEVLRILDTQTASLPRTREVFVETLFVDCCFKIMLTEHRDYMGHARTLVDLVVGPKCAYKTGMTCQPHERMYTQWCAYQREATQRRDKTNWDTMVIMYVHEQQSTVAMLEHALNDRGLLDRRCRNGRSEFDDYKRFRKSEPLPPYFLYMVFGESRR